MPDQYAVAERQRAALLRGDRQVSRLVLDAYFQAWKTIRADLEVVTGQLAEARARGEEPSAAWLYQEERLATLKRQVEAEVAQIAARLGPFLTGEQARWVARATEDAAALLRVAAGGAAAGRAGTVTAEFVRLNPGAVEGVIGFLSDGSPLQALLNELGPDAAQRVGNALTQGVILGQSPADIARAARRGLAGNAARAMLISRDAVIRSYQETAHQNYLANAEVLSGWRWWASLSPRTCASCISLHGTLHPLTERLREHPGGRCTQVPVVKGEPEPAFQTGAEWFAEQPADVQRAMVGSKKYAALQAGTIALEDLSQKRTSRRWGPHFGEATYAEAVANAKTRTTPPPPVVTPPKPAPRPPAAVSPIPTWGPFANVDAAEREARARYPQIDFDFKGMHVETVTATLRQFAVLAAAYPLVVERLRYVGGYKRVPPPDGIGLRGGKRAPYAHATTDGRRIGLNPVWYGNPAKLAESLREDTATGWHIKGGDTVESLVTHEFGHLVDYWLRAVPNTIAAQPTAAVSGVGLVAGTVTEWKRSHRAPPTLSGYAAASVNEGWAESFAAQYHAPPDVRDTPYVKKQRALLAALHPSHWRDKEKGEWHWSDEGPADQRQAAYDRLLKWQAGFS